MSAVRIIAAFTENKPGETARITKILTDAGVNIRWVTIATLGGSAGVMKFVVDKVDAAMTSLKQKGITVNFLEPLAIEVKDQVGTLHSVCDCLARHNINLDNTSGFVANHRAILILEVADIAGAKAALQKQGHRILTQEEILSL